MNNKRLVSIIIGALVVVMAAVVIFTQDSKKAEAPVSNIGQAVNNVTPEKPNPAVSTSSSSLSSGEKSYTLAQVSTHNNGSDCWTAINGGVYNVTSWVDNHPGGRQAILSLCGHDGSMAFNGQHGGQARPASELATFRIGKLAK